MRLARLETADGFQVFAGRGGRWVRLTDPAGRMLPARGAQLLGTSCRPELTRLLDDAPSTAWTDVPLDRAATVMDGGDIWGAGLNYRRHSEELHAEQPSSGPGSYLRPNGCLVGNGQPVELPDQSTRVTAEAELGLVIGTRCKNVRRDGWRAVVAGVTTVLDMTAEDVIRENPRYIPWAKGFDTFCSIGPQLVSLDEFDDAALRSLRVSTVRNGEVVASAPTGDMKYDLSFLVEYFSAGRTLHPGTVICTGTPGAAVIRPGDSISAVVDHVGTLTHAVTGRVDVAP